MRVQDVIRAWTDPSFRSSLSEADRAALPANPAGIIELSGTALDQVSGGGGKGKGKGKGKKSKGSGKSSRSGRSRRSGRSSRCCC